MDKLINTLTREFLPADSVSCKRIFKADAQKDIITITLKFYDRNNDLLNSATCRFTKNELSKSQRKLFIKCSYKEVENLFLFAKDDILHSIITDKNNELNELSNSIEALKTMTSFTFAPSIKTPVIHSNSPSSQLKLLM